MADLRHALRRLKHPARAVLAVCVAVLVLSLGVGGWAWSADRDQDRAAVAERSALRAAREHVVDVLSYDFSSVEQDMKRAEANLTGDFADDFTKMADDLIIPTARAKGIRTHAEVTSAGVVRSSADEVVVLLFVNQTTTSRRVTEPTLDGSRLEVTVQRAGDGWLISELRPL